MKAKTEDRVQVAPLREAFLNSGMTAAEVALALGWMQSKRRQRGDGSRLKRALGISPEGKRGPGCRNQGPRAAAGLCFNKTISEETALQIARVIDVTPWEIGL